MPPVGARVLPMLVLGAMAYGSTRGTADEIAPAPVTFEISAGSSKRVTWQTGVTDAELINPAGYFPAERSQYRLVERVTIQNSSDAIIRNPVLVINGRDFLTVNDPFAALGLSPDATLSQLFAIWKERRVHASTGLKANALVLEVLRTFGVTLCGEDSKCLADLVIAAGGSARAVPVSGHVVYEFSLRNETAVIDGDQNTIYLRLDNSTLANESDLKSDPFLVTRTKVFGRQMPFQLASAWMNSARFDRQVSEVKAARKSQPVSPDVNWEFLPGEGVEFFSSATALPTILSRDSVVGKNPILRESVIAVAFHLDAKARMRRGNTINLPFPAVALVDGEGNVESIDRDSDGPQYSVVIPSDAEGDLTVLCQAAKGMFPGLPERVNLVRFDAEKSNDAALTLTYHLNRSGVSASSVPAPKVQIHAEPHHGLPVFQIESVGADALWWQLSDSETFCRVLPNFDRVQTSVEMLKIATPIETSFFSPGRQWFFRAKHRVNGVWSVWNDAIAFTVAKPAAPDGVQVSVAHPEAAELTWDTTDGDVWIFGSDRMDFLPEIYSNIDSGRIENSAIRESTPNSNLLAKVAGGDGHAELPRFAFYRLVTQKDGRFSVPSGLVSTPADQRLRPATVLQNSHEPPATDIAVPVALP
jgi:hypothetical protein